MIKFSYDKLKKIEFYLQEISQIEKTSYGLGDQYIEDIEKHFCGTLDGSPLPPQVSPTPQIACNEFVDYITNKYFPSDGSWINISDLNENRIKVLHELRRRVEDSNFYFEIRNLIKNAVLFETGAMVCNWGSGDLFFSNYNIRQSNINISDSDIRTRGYVQKQRKMSGLSKQYNIPEEESDNDVQTYILYLPVEKRYITEGNPDKNDKFFSIEIYNGQILEPKDGELPTYSLFPIFRFRSGFESLGKQALGYAIELESITYEFRERIKYANNPKLVVPQEFFNKYTDLIEGKPENLFRAVGGAIPIDPGGTVPTTLKLDTDIPVDQNYIQRLEHNIFHVFKSDLIARSKIAGLNALEEAQRMIGIHNEIAPFLGGMINRTAKNLIGRAHQLLRTNDADYKKMSENEEINIFSDFHLQQIKKQIKISNAIKLLEIAGAIGSIDRTDLDGFRGDVILEKAASELELPEAIGPPEETDKVRGAMAESQTQQGMEEAKTEDYQAAAQLKTAQADQLQQGYQGG